MRTWSSREDHEQVAQGVCMYMQGVLSQGLKDLYTNKTYHFLCVLAKRVRVWNELGIAVHPVSAWPSLWSHMGPNLVGAAYPDVMHLHQDWTRISSPHQLS